MALCDMQNKMLFEIAPDIIPDGYCNDVELMLWSKYLESKDG